MVLKNAYNLYDGLQKLGITNLRQQQEAPMQAIFDGKDAIVLMPTAGGKSLLYQLPAVMDDTGKLTLVISPLKALQLDQVDALRSKGIRAAVLNSDLSAAEHSSVLEDMTRRGGLLYLAPEQLQNMAVADALRTANLTLVLPSMKRTLCRRPRTTSARPTARSAASFIRSRTGRRSLH